MAAPAGPLGGGGMIHPWIAQNLRTLNIQVQQAIALGHTTPQQIQAAVQPQLQLIANLFQQVQQGTLQLLPGQVAVLPPIMLPDAQQVVGLYAQQVAPAGGGALPPHMLAMLAAAGAPAAGPFLAGAGAVLGPPPGGGLPPPGGGPPPPGAPPPGPAAALVPGTTAALVPPAAPIQVNFTNQYGSNIAVDQARLQTNQQELDTSYTAIKNFLGQLAGLPGHPVCNNLVIDVVLHTVLYEDGATPPGTHEVSFEELFALCTLLAQKTELETYMQSLNHAVDAIWGGKDSSYRSLGENMEKHEVGAFAASEEGVRGLKRKGYDDQALVAYSTPKWNNGYVQEVMTTVYEAYKKRLQEMNPAPTNIDHLLQDALTRMQAGVVALHNLEEQLKLRKEAAAQEEKALNPNDATYAGNPQKYKDDKAKLQKEQETIDADLQKLYQVDWLILFSNLTVGDEPLDTMSEPQAKAAKALTDAEAALTTAQNTPPQPLGVQEAIAVAKAAAEVGKAAKGAPQGAQGQAQTALTNARAAIGALGAAQAAAQTAAQQAGPGQAAAQVAAQALTKAIQAAQGEIQAAERAMQQGATQDKRAGLERANKVCTFLNDLIHAKVQKDYDERSNLKKLPGVRSFYESPKQPEVYDYAAQAGNVALGFIQNEGVRNSACVAYGAEKAKGVRVSGSIEEAIVRIVAKRGVLPAAPTAPAVAAGAGAGAAAPAPGTAGLPKLFQKMLEGVQAAPPASAGGAAGAVPQSLDQIINQAVDTVFAATGQLQNLSTAPTPTDFIKRVCSQL